MTGQDDPEPPKGEPVWDQDAWEAWPGWSMPWPPPTVIVLKAEWTDTFLWNRSPNRDRSADDYVLDADVLGVSPRLTARLRAWNDRYGAGGAADGEGRALAYDLQAEFDARQLTVEVLYHDEDDHERPIRDRPRRP